MSAFEELVKELIVLSELIAKREFRACFIKHFTIKVNDLLNMCSGRDVKILERLQLKLLEPLIIHLRTTLNSDDKCVLIECIIQVLKITLVHSVDEFFDVYTVVFFQIFKDGNLLYQPSEELKECALECCRFLLKNSSQSVLDKVYAQEFGGKFSLGISISVNIVKQEKSIKLRTAALDFLIAASQFENQVKHKEEFHNKIGDLFMLYLPGILAPLLEVILRDETQHHSITTKALSCWGHVLCVVMRDTIEEESLSDIEIMKLWVAHQKETQDNIVDIKAGLKEKKRTKLWLKSAAITLQPLLTKLLDLRKHSHPKCRLELTQVMVNLLKNCIKNLKNCLPIIIEVLVSSGVDEDAKVCNVAETALMQFEAKCEEKNIGLFVSAIEENLYLLINKLPQTIRSGNEQLLLPSLKSLLGYLRILGRLNRLQHLISFSSTLRKLISILKMSFELENHPEISKQDFSTWDDESSQIWCKSWMRFRYFTDQSIKTQLEEICHVLGKFGHSETMLDFLLDTYYEDSAFKKEILLILNEVVSGSERIEDHVISHLLDFYLEPQNLNPPLSLNCAECTNPKEVQANVVQVALIMEGIGKLAKNIGNRFQDCLFKSLYYVLERMSCTYLIIREAAKKSAMQIAVSCTSEGTVKSLIQSNVDYLTYHLTVKLRRNDKSVFDVIVVVMRNSPFETLPNIEEIINSVLKSSSENFKSPHTLSYLKLFQTFVTCVRKWMKTNAKPPLPPTQPEETDMDRLLKFLKSTSEKNAESEEKEGEEEEEEEETEAEKEVGTEEKIQETIAEEPQKSELPRHLKLTLAVANHCLHYLSSKDSTKIIIVLEILNECVWVLADEENDLLPLVHNIWSPLVTKFELITDPLIISRSFKLLCTLSFTSKDFIRRRTLKNVLPALESFLIKQATKSKLKNSASGYFFTQNFKLQRELLGNLGKLTFSLGLFERESNSVVESALPYLSAFQPQELQAKCIILFEDLKVYDAPLVWFKVKPLIDNAEFAKNAETVLCSLK